MRFHGFGGLACPLRAKTAWRRRREKKKAADTRGSDGGPCRNSGPAKEPSHRPIEFYQPLQQRVTGLASVDAVVNKSAGRAPFPSRVAPVDETSSLRVYDQSRERDDSPEAQN